MCGRSPPAKHPRGTLLPELRFERGFACQRRWRIARLYAYALAAESLSCLFSRRSPLLRRFRMDAAQWLSSDPLGGTCLSFRSACCLSCCIPLYQLSAGLLVIQEFTLFSASAIAATFHAASRVVVFLPVLVQKPILVLLCFLAMSKPLHRRLGSDEEEERSQGGKAPVSGRFDVRSNLGTAELQR